MSGSFYGMGPYGKGKYSRGGFSLIAPIGVFTQIRVAGAVIRVGFHVIDQPTVVQLSGETLWAKVTVPACMPWFTVGLPASWTATPNSAGAMFP
jgi:hypothetical protein